MWPSALNLENVRLIKILNITVNITMTTEALREHDMLYTAGYHEFMWNDKMWTKT